MLQEEWRITGTAISSRSSADVYYGNRTVRIPGEMMVSYFLADPYEMFWLPEERRRNRLSGTERTAVMKTVSDFFRHKKEPVIFLTEEIEDRSLKLACMIKDKKISRRNAVAMLKKEFPDLLSGFYRDMIIDSLAGAKWYND